MNQERLAMLYVQNTPKYALKYEYWVITVSNHVPWFYGAFESVAEAEKACDSESRMIVENALYE